MEGLFHDSRRTQVMGYLKNLAAYTFPQFWNAYPRRVAKADAMKAWGKVPHEAEAILIGLDRWCCSREWRDTLYVPYPATFLNRRQWEDEPTTDPVKIEARVGAGPQFAMTPEHEAKMRARELVRQEYEAKRKSGELKGVSLDEYRRSVA